MKSENPESKMNDEIEDPTSCLSYDALSQSGQSETAEETYEREGSNDTKGQLQTSGIIGTWIWGFMSWLNRLIFGEGPISFIVQAWRGKAKLWKVWWLLGGLVIIFKIITVILFLKGTGISTNRELNTVMLWLVFGVEISFLRMAWVCAPNVTHRFWTSVARNIILIVIILSILLAIGNNAIAKL